VRAKIAQKNGDDERLTQDSMAARPPRASLQIVAEIPSDRPTERRTGGAGRFAPQRFFATGETCDRRKLRLHLEISRFPQHRCTAVQADALDHAG
jgi:hypothetical protein